METIARPSVNIKNKLKTVKRVQYKYKNLKLYVKTIDNIFNVNMNNKKAFQSKSKFEQVLVDRTRANVKAGGEGPRVGEQTNCQDGGLTDRHD